MMVCHPSLFLHDYTNRHSGSVVLAQLENDLVYFLLFFWGATIFWLWAGPLFWRLFPITSTCIAIWKHFCVQKVIIGLLYGRWWWDSAGSSPCSLLAPESRAGSGTRSSIIVFFGTVTRKNPLGTCQWAEKWPTRAVPFSIFSRKNFFLFHAL